ncbi:MAG: hypothetical protein LBQ69_03080 [Treponema sp.]|jgi:hypothetical protein|nr:hypothetical protein [Treponema sp.]
MKKINFAAAAVLLAAILAACNAFPPDEVGNPPVYYDDNGRQLVEVSIGAVGAARSLVATAAPGNAYYFEVVFYDVVNTKYYRRAWMRTPDPVTIRIPPLKYNNDLEGKAVLFAGAKVNGVNVLLAIGKISTGTANVTASTTSITFEMSALNAVLDANDWASCPLEFTSGSSQLGHKTFSSESLPIFELDSDETIVATYTIGLVGTVTSWAPFAGLVVLRDFGTVSIQGATDLAIATGHRDLTSDINSTIDNVTPDNSSPPISFGGTIGFEFDTATASGLALLTFSFPVSAIATDTLAITPEPWVIRNGFYNALGDIDNGSGTSLNGGILLGIGEYDSPNDGNVGVTIGNDLYP